MRKEMKIILFVISLLFIFSCKKHSKDKTDNLEVVNNKVFRMMSYTETERSFIDFDFDYDEPILRDCYLERLEDGVVITVEDEEDLVSILKTDSSVELYQNNSLVSEFSNQKREISNDPELLEKIYLNLDEMTNFLSKDIILKELGKYIVSEVDKIYTLKDTQEDIYIEVTYDSKKERILSLTVIDKIDGKYEEITTEYLYAVIEGTYIVVTKITDINIRDTFERKTKSERDIMEETSYLLGINVNDINIVSDTKSGNRKVPVIMSENSDITVVEYSNIYLNSDLLPQPRNSKQLKGGNIHERK